MSASGLRRIARRWPITFQIEVRGDITDWVDTIDLVVGHWRKVGIEAHLKTRAPSSP